MKVFLVDDSIVFRRGMANALESLTGVKVAGMASNGRLALDQLARMAVDLVIVDMEMPEMDGLTFIKEYRKINRDAKILVFSALSERGARITIDALLAGANDFLPKSFLNAKKGDPLEAMKEVLLPKVKQFMPAGGGAEVARPTAPASSASRRSLRMPPRAIAIGSSTGGPEALKVVLSGLDASLKVPIFIVQHMPALFTAELARMLQKTCTYTLKEAVAGEVVKEATAYIAPGDFHMTVSEKDGQVVIGLNQDPKVNYVRPAVDVFLQSAAPIYKGQMPTVILTGMGEDGMRGVATLKEYGATVIIQDKESSVVWGMPGAVHRAGLFDVCVPLSKVSEEIKSLISTKTNLKEAM